MTLVLFVCLQLHQIKKIVGLLTTAHHYSTVDTTPRKMHVQLVVIPVFCIMTTCAAVCQLSHTPKTAFVTSSKTNIVHMHTCQRKTSTIWPDPLNIAKNYVAELMDRPLQRRLRDTHRNNTQRRVVTNDNQDKPLMIFETNDMVFVYNPEGRSSSDKTGKITYWFAKQDSKRIRQEEMHFLQKLNFWRPIEKWKVPK